MEYEKIKQLMEDMGNSKLSSIDIDFPDGTKIRMKKAESTSEKIAEKEIKHDIKEEIQPIEEKVENQKIVKSPMVGTFYLKPSPTSEPYTEIGNEVKKGDVICIIEAMKLLNEIESEFEGRVKEILVKDGETVEYGEPLFIIG